MITNFIVIILSLLINMTAVILPAWRLPDYFLSSFTGSSNILTVLNGYIPIAAGFKIFIILLSFEIAIILTRLIFGVISIIRGGGNIEV